MSNEETYLVLAVRAGGEVDRFTIDAADFFEAMAKACEKIAKRYDAEDIIGVQIDPLAFPYFQG